MSEINYGSKCRTAHGVQDAKKAVSLAVLEELVESGMERAAIAQVAGYASWKYLRLVVKERGRLLGSVADRLNALCERVKKSGGQSKLAAKIYPNERSAGMIHETNESFARVRDHDL